MKLVFSINRKAVFSFHTSPRLFLWIIYFWIIFLFLHRTRVLLISHQHVRVFLWGVIVQDTALCVNTKWTIALQSSHLQGPPSGSWLLAAVGLRLGSVSSFLLSRADFLSGEKDREHAQSAHSVAMRQQPGLFEYFWNDFLRQWFLKSVSFC